MGLMTMKIITSIVIVILLAEMSKSVNPLLGGMLSGLPLGAGLSLYFISYSEGVQFVIRGIPWAIAGLASSILFCFFYLLGGKWFEFNNTIVSIIFSTMLGFISFFLSGFWMYKLNLHLLGAFIVFATVFITNIVVIKKMKMEPKTKSEKKSPNSFLQVLMSGMVVGIIIVIITGVASMVGSKWAGILSSFPSTLFALLLVLHYEEGNNLYPSVIYGFSYSVSTLVVFYLSCLYLLPKVGLNLGFIIVYTVSLLYLYVFNKFLSYNEL